MKKNQLLVVGALILLLSRYVIMQQPWKADELRTVAVSPQEGFTVVSDNPVTVSPGETAVFKIEFDDNYWFGTSTSGVYEDGVLTVNDVQHSETIYLSTLKNCRITLNSTANGSVQLLTGDTVMQGETVTLQVVPDENYVNGSIDVNGVTYPAPAGETFSFVVREDSLLTVNFEGKQLDFLTVSGNLGHIRVNNAAEEYHYGDVIQLESLCNDEHIVFIGWSKGGFLSEGGKLLSSDAYYEYNLLDDTTLYAFRVKQMNGECYLLSLEHLVYHYRRVKTNLFADFAVNLIQKFNVVFVHLRHLLPSSYIFTYILLL